MSEPDSKLLTELSLLYIGKKNPLIFNYSKTKLLYLYITSIFSPLGLVGILVKYCDLFHLVLHFAEESRCSGTIPPGFMCNSASVLCCQRLDRWCLSVSLSPSVFVSFKRAARVLLFIHPSFANSPAPHPPSALQQPILHYRLENMHTSFSSCHCNNSFLVPSNHVTVIWLS